MAARRMTKTISRHNKREPARLEADRLDDDLAKARKRGRNQYVVWLKANGYPEWTVNFEVKKALIRHWRVVAVGPWR